MSRTNRARLILTAMLALFLAAASIAFAQKPPHIAGDYTGALHGNGVSLRLALHVKADKAGKLSVTIDSLDQHAMGITASNAILKGDSFTFEVPPVSGKYSGTLSADGATIDGIWNQGTPIPLVFTRWTGGAMPTAIPTPTPAPAMPPVALDRLKPVLDSEMAPVFARGLLSPPSGGGLVIGVMDHGKRAVFAYGTASTDSIFEIGSVTKTFTGLILAQMVVQKKVTLDEPIRSLLPAFAVGKPVGEEISLVDLATHHSGLPRMPDNFKPSHLDNPFLDYDATRLYNFLARNGVGKATDAPYLYSNLGFGLLGYGLSLRAGLNYEQLLAIEVTGPLHLGDTVITLSAEQHARFIQGYDANFHKTGEWDFQDTFAGAGAIRSTANDMLTYLEANLHPEKYAVGLSADSPATTLPAAVAIDHQLRASTTADNKIALAWEYDSNSGSYGHGGGTGGYSSAAAFIPRQDLAIVVLYNRDNGNPRFADRVEQNVYELMSGKPSTPVDFMSEEEAAALRLRQSEGK